MKCVEIMSVVADESDRPIGVISLRGIYEATAGTAS